VARVGGLIGLSLPSFWLGTLIIVLFPLPPLAAETRRLLDFVRDPLANLKLLFSCDHARLALAPRRCA